ncbi:MAG TPA: hypothetical protein VI731_07440, partial [Bacteroidia bacterium]|nr:hypothetical protein [Bacteroidia bacterium]
MWRLFFALTLFLSVNGFTQTPSGVSYPFASCIGGSCPGTATIPSHISATYFDTINEVLYLGGRFNDMGGNSRPGLAAVNAANGTLLSWSPIVDNGYVFSIAKSGDTVIVGGTFTQINGTTRNRIAAISASTGSLLSTFATGTTVSTDTVMSLMVLGGKVYAGGRFTNIASTARTNLARFTLSTGALESWISTPTVNGPVKKLLWFGTSIVTLCDNPAGPQSEISTLTIVTGARTLRAQTEIDEKINDMALRGSLAYVIGTFSQINSIFRYTTAACDLTNGNVTAWNPAPATFSYDTRCRYSIEYFRDSLYIGTFDAGSNNPAYHKMYVSHYVNANLRVLKTYQSNLTGLNGYYNDAIIIGNARMLEIERFAQHTAFPSGSINCKFYSYCLKPPSLPGIWTSAPTLVCPGDTNILYSVLHAGYFSAYNWQSLSANAVPTPNLNTALVDFNDNFSPGTQIRIWGITSCGISTTLFRAINVTALPLPDANAGPDDSLNCVISQLTLHGTSATAGASFTWDWSTGAANADSVQVNSQDSYVLTV